MTNIQYTIERDKLIPSASAFANRMTANNQKHPEWAMIFFNEMDRMAVEVGIQNVRYHRNKTFLPSEIKDYTP